jgi:hypothetical protein
LERALFSGGKLKQSFHYLIVRDDRNLLTLKMLAGTVRPKSNSLRFLMSRVCAQQNC